MARFKADEAKNYGGQGGGGFLQLKDDGDTVQIRFMYDSIEDVEGLSVHHVKVGTREDGRDILKYVNCLRNYNDPVEACPFCAARIPVKAKLFVPVYDIKANETKTWERGKKFFTKMTSICTRYPHVVSKVFEIERNGAKGDLSTSYEIYPLDEGYDEKLKVSDLPAKPNIEGLVMEKTAEEMEYYLKNNRFPISDDEEEEEEVRPRRGSVDDTPRRRTPANRGDAF